MNLNREYYPALGSARQDVVLLHGWGCNREIWRPLLSHLRPWANVTLLDIPGLAPQADALSPVLEQVQTAVLAQAPQSAVYLGWSLGGQLAMALAANQPERVAAVVTVCSNPSFIARDDWPGMALQQLTEFSAAFATQPRRALQRFDSLQLGVGSGPLQKQLRRQLQSLRNTEAGKCMSAGLGWLADFDLRGHYQSMVQPQLHLMAKDDALLPQDLPAELTTLLQDQPQAEVQILASGHVAPLQSAAGIAQACSTFLEQQNVLNEADDTPVSVFKTDVADSFSRAAQQYDSVAQLQRDVGEHLAQQLVAVTEPVQTMLDLGCGTGYFSATLKQRFPAADYIGLDLAEGMARYAREHHPDAGQWLVADAEALPIASNSVDLIFSSLAVQWCYRPQLLFAELARVLKPGGRCVFSSLGPQTLKELRSAWAAVDAHRHVNTFLPEHVLQQACESIAEVNLNIETLPFCMHYTQVSELLNELKTLGAHNVNRDRQAGLTSRRTLQGMLKAYEDWREEGLLPATYEVYFGVLQKL